MGAGQLKARIFTKSNFFFYGLVALILSLFALIFGSMSVHAQAPQERITLSPASKLYTVDAGKTITNELTVINDGDVAYDFLVYARPYSVINNQYDNPNFTTTSPRTNLYGWVQFPETKFHIEAGKTVKVPYSIRVPAEAAPGGHYGVIFAETQPTSSQANGNAVLRKKRVGSIIYVTVNGDVKRAGETSGSSIPFWQVQPPLQATVAAKNTGNTHFTDTTQLTVRDVFGRIKYRAVKDYQVLPDTTRTITLTWDKASWFGLYKVETEQKFLGQSVTSEGFVLMMPRYLPAVLLVILAIGGVYAMLRRRKK